MSRLPASYRNQSDTCNAAGQLTRPTIDLTGLSGTALPIARQG